MVRGDGPLLAGKLLGHSHIQRTARCIHFAWVSIKASEVRVATSIGAQILLATEHSDSVNAKPAREGEHSERRSGSAGAC